MSGRGKLAMAIFAPKKGKEMDMDAESEGAEESTEDDKPDLDEELGAVADDFLAAIESKDRAGIVEALKNAHSICSAHADDGYEDAT